MEWLKWNEICYNTNNWGDESKTKKLPTSLKGEVLITRLELTAKQQSNYEVAKNQDPGGNRIMWFMSMGDFHL